MLPVVLTFVLVAGVIIGLYWLFVAKPESDEQSALRKRMKAGQTGTRRAGGTTSGGGLVRDEAPLSGIAALDRVLHKSGKVSEPARRLLQRAGLSITVGTLVLLCAVAGLAGYAVVLMVTRLWFFALFVGGLTAVLPIGVIRFLAKRRVGQFEEQFPEAIDLLSRALKAGHAFTTGLSMVADEMADPVGSEFKLAFDRQNYGMPMADALRSLGDRVPLLDARFFVTAVLTQREAGGNLSEVLDNLAAVIRERFRVKRQVRVVTAHARMTGWVLVMLPVGLALVLVYLSPQHMSVLWTDPTGVRMVTGAIILQVIGSLIIRKLVDVEY
jgi:tight adherence protein B